MRQFLTTDLPKTAILVGTYRELTIKQVDFLKSKGFKINPPSRKNPDTVDIFTFHLDHDHSRINSDFVLFLAEYDLLMMSGGATANYILEKAGFNYIENLESFQPLISLGRVAGGSLDGKLVILKGGLIGEVSCYYDLLKWAGCLYE